MVPRSLIVLLVLTLTSVTVSAQPSAAANAERERPSAAADLLTGPAVKKAVNGKGRWRVLASSIDALGSKPRGCRSDTQMLAYAKVSARSYSGTQMGVPNSIWAGAQIAVLHYPNVASARDAMQRNASYPRRCPKVTEWVCTECDGVWTTRRSRVHVPRVGAESIGWSLREVGNSKSNGYTILARRSETVVRVTVTRTRDVTTENGWKYPPLIKKRVALRLTRMALGTAT